MSRHETWRTRKYWKKIGGLLIEEFVAVQKGLDNGARLIDGVIVLGEQTKIHYSNFYDIEGKDIICIQTKRGRVGMYLMGQAFFSVELLRLFKPKSIRSVLICGKDDVILRPICEKSGIEVVVIKEDEFEL